MVLFQPHHHHRVLTMNMFLLPSPRCPYTFFTHLFSDLIPKSAPGTILMLYEIETGIIMNSVLNKLAG